MILALDLGTETGWCRTTPGMWQSGHVSFKEGRHSGSGMRFVLFRAFLNKIVADEKPTVVVYEEVRRHIGTDAAHAYGGYLATLQAWCHENDMPYQGVPVGTIKKHATGSGSAGKLQMMESAGRILGRALSDMMATVYVADHNEADAVCLADYWVSAHGA